MASCTQFTVVRSLSLASCIALVWRRWVTNFHSQSRSICRSWGCGHRRPGDRWLDVLAATNAGYSTIIGRVSVIRASRKVHSLPAIFMGVARVSNHPVPHHDLFRPLHPLAQS